MMKHSEFRAFVVQASAEAKSFKPGSISPDEIIGKLQGLIAQKNYFIATCAGGYEIIKKADGGRGLGKRTTLPTRMQLFHMVDCIEIFNNKVEAVYLKHLGHETIPDPLGNITPPEKYSKKCVEEKIIPSMVRSLNSTDAMLIAGMGEKSHDYENKKVLFICGGTILAIGTLAILIKALRSKKSTTPPATFTPPMSDTYVSYEEEEYMPVQDTNIGIPGEEPVSTEPEVSITEGTAI